MRRGDRLLWSVYMYTTAAAVSLGISKHVTHTHTHTECGYCLEQLTVHITNLTELINITLIQLPEPTLIIDMTILNLLRENISRVQVSVCLPTHNLFIPTLLLFLLSFSLPSLPSPPSLFLFLPVVLSLPLSFFLPSSPLSFHLLFSPLPLHPV